MISTVQIMPRQSSIYWVCYKSNEEDEDLLTPPRLPKVSGMKMANKTIGTMDKKKDPIRLVM